MWARGAAIRPVPPYAVLDAAALERVEEELSSDADDAALAAVVTEATGGPPRAPHVDLDDAFGRFEATQPHLAERVASVLGRPLDETALALGYFLCISIWLAFDRTFGDRLGAVTADALRATDDAVALEEELRASHAEEPLDLEDVVAQEQPAIVTFVHGHVEAALDAVTNGRGDPGELRDEGAEAAPRSVDIDDVHLVYRTVLVLTLALSHAVAADEAAGAPPSRGSNEILA